MAEKVEILITAKDGASKAVKSVTKSFDGLNKAAAQAALKIGTATALGLGAALAATIPIALDAEDVQADLAATIASTGGAAGITAEEANALADSLASVTKESDETIVAAESMLLTFINIGEDVFPRATEMALNMGQKFGSVDSAAIQLGKALNDPIAGVSALTEVGVSFTEQQKEMIKTMVEAGDVAGAQTVILDELEVEVGGLARAMGQTNRGRIQRFINQMVDVGQVIGAKVIEPLGNLADTLGRFVTVLTESGAASIQFQTTLVDIFGGELGNKIFFIVNNLIDMVEIIREMGFAGIVTLQFWGELNDIFGSDIGNRIHEISVSIFNLWLRFKLFLDDVLIPFVSKHGDLIISMFVKLGAVLAGGMIVAGIASVAGAILALINPITLVIGAIILLAMAWERDWGGIRTFITNKVWPKIKPILEAIIDFLEVAIPIAIDATLKAWEQLKILVPLAMQVILAFWNNKLKPGIDGMVTAWERLKVIVDLAWDQMKIFTELAILAITAFWENKLKPGIDGMSAAWQGLKAIVDLAWDQMKILIDLGIQVILAFWENKLKPGIDRMKTAWIGLKAIVDLVWNGIKNAITGAIDDITGKISDLVDAIEDIDFGLLGDIGGAIGGIIPGLATGGAFSGFARTGEEGEELVYAPGGAVVFPNDLLKQMESIAGDTFNLNVDTQATSAGVAQDFRMMEAFAG